jgi:hypothetical protein
MFRVFGYMFSQGRKIRGFVKNMERCQVLPKICSGTKYLPKIWKFVKFCEKYGKYVKV